jgi:hypothetical protein
MDHIYKKLNSMDKKLVQQVYCKVKKIKRTSLNKKKIIDELLKPLEKKYKMMRGLRRGGTSTVLQYNNKYEDNVENDAEDDDYDEPFKEPIDPQVLSSPWDIYVKNVGEVKYFVAVSKPNKRDGAPISNIVVGVFYDGKIFLHDKYNACKYKGFSTVITPLTYPKTGVLVNNGFTYSGNFVKDRISSTFASFGVDMQHNELQDKITASEFKNIVYTLHNYIKTSIYATPLEICDINNSKNCLRKCGKFKHCDEKKASEKGVDYYYTHEACFIYNWGTPPYTYELLLRKDPYSFVQVYPYETENVLDVGYSLKN